LHVPIQNLTSESYDPIFGHLVGLLGRGISRRKATIYTGKHYTENEDTHPCLERDSKSRSQCSSGQRPYAP